MSDKTPMNLDKLKELASPELEALLERARNLPPMTAAEILEQKVSWVYGMLGHKSAITKAEIRSRLSAAGLGEGEQP